jgi:3-hydroxybutyryl-CoA dehydrogenase
MAIKKVAVLGCGLMGSGIAQVCAQAGCEVTVIEVSEDFLNKGLGSIDKQLGKLVEKGRLSTEERDQTLERLHGATQLEDAAGAEIVIEAIIENIEEKHRTYSRLDKICPPETIFASNTSSLSITQMMTATSPERQRRFVGMHFFNPVPVMKLVEVVVALDTSDDTVDLAERFVSDIGKRAIRTKDRSGFIVNMLLVPYLMAAVRMYEDGFASREDIDEGMRLGCGHPMGPLTLCDFIGLDVLYAVCDSLYDEFKRPEYAPPPLLKRMVVSGHHGRKAGQGFYSY